MPCSATLVAMSQITPSLYQAARTTLLASRRFGLKPEVLPGLSVPNGNRHPHQSGSAQPQGSAYNPLLPYLSSSVLPLSFFPFFPLPASSPSSSVGRQRVGPGLVGIISGAILSLPTSHPLCTPTAWYFSQRVYNK